ncbi:hypothetical protein CVT25_010005 [Psilocybe cyanescens]|uniref:NACHT domain-containing protein n=1 Tax=Psilocybe cyanescens TaxID=93625 RepID=A0A409X393_PSICY|nr:hypothetical protein CVT25_010005 [Psilocybe cyanescens]
MASSSSGNKAKRLFWNRLKEKDSQPTAISEIDESASLAGASHSSSPSIAPEEDTTFSLSIQLDASKEGLGTASHSLLQSNVKEGLGIAGRFAQTLLKKLPGCIDGNPVKMALSIVQMIIEIKDELGDNKDALAEGLQKTKFLLDEVVATARSSVSEEFEQEMETYRTTIENEKNNLLSLTQKLKSLVQNLDYEKYKKDIEGICKVIDRATELFILKMQLNIRKTTAHLHDEIKKASLNDLNPSKKADYKTVLEGQSLRREACAEGTRVDILGEITHWANDQSSDSPHVFWLTGQAGSGKTTIAYTIAKRFEKGQATVLGANFLCSRQFEQTRSVHRILPTIAYQLAYKCRSYVSALHIHVDDKSAVVDHDVSEQMQELLVEPWSNANHPNNLPTYLIIIDALDEINESGGSNLLAVLLTTISQQHFTGLKFLVTSRTDPRIVELWDEFKFKTICRLQDVPIEDAEADVERYLDAKLPNLAGSPDLAELRSRASGLFIYAATAVRILTTSRSITHKEQMRRLSNFLSKPSSSSAVGKDKSPIDGLYEQILYEAFSDFMDEEDLKPRLRILFTFLCAAERISTSVAATLMEDDDELAKAVLNDLHAVLYIQDGRVFWYHASFPDFLLSENRSNFRIGTEELNFWCNETVHHTLLAGSCFRVMKSNSRGLRFNIGDISSSYLLDSEHADELSKNLNNNIAPVLRYSSLHWAHHLSSTSLDQDIDDICNYISDFLPIRVLFWIEAMNLLGWSNQCTGMLHQAREWVSTAECPMKTKSALARDLLECANLATYFAGCVAAESTPHLYTSSLATWKSQSRLSKNWKRQFSRIPVFIHANSGNDVPLLTINSEAEVYGVAFSNDGTVISSGSDDECVHIWDASTGKRLKVLRGHTEWVWSVVFSSDDKSIVSGSADCTLRVWDVSTGECLKVLRGHSGTVNSVAISKNDLWIASGSNDKSIHLWDVSTGDVVKVMMGHTDSVKSVAFSGDNGWLASGSSDGSVRVWDIPGGAQLRIMKGHTDYVTSVAFSANGSQIVSGSRDRSVQVWNAATGKKLKKLWGGSAGANSVAFSGNGAWIVSGLFDRSVRLWDASTGKALKVLKGHTSGVNSVAFSIDGTRVVSGSGDRSVRMWNVSTWTELDKTHSGAVPVISVASSRDGTQILFGSKDGSVHLWDATTHQELQVLEECSHQVNVVAFSNDGTHIACGSGNEVWVKDVSRNTEAKVLGRHTDNIKSVAFSGDGSFIVSASGDTVRLWDISKGVQLKEMDIRHAQLAVFTQDDKQIVYVPSEGSVRVWDIFSDENSDFNPKVMSVHPGSANGVALSSDAAHIVSARSYNGTVTIRDTLTGSTLKVLQGETNFMCRTPAFSSDGTHIVSGSSDKTVRIWNMSTGEEVTNLRGRHTSSVKSITVSNDSRSIISGSRDGSVIIWGMDVPAWYLDHEGTGWVLSPSTNQRLMWAPPDAHVLQRSNCHVLAGQSTYSYVNFDNAMIGPD